MTKWIGWAVFAILIFWGGWWLYNRNAAANMTGGDVVSRDSYSSSDSSLAGKPVGPTPSRSDAPGTVNTAPVSGAAAATTTTTTKTVTNPDNSTTIFPSMASKPAAAMPSSLPVSDTVAPNPPNGLAFGGTGKFQWYRQGNLTWRVNTQTGSACIAFATLDEWRKQVVYSHGCGNS